MNLQITSISAEIRASSRPGAVKAYADVLIQTTDGVLQEKGYAVIQKDNAPPFVGFPSRPGNNPGKFFPIIEAEGDIRKAIVDAITIAYAKFSKS